MVRLAKRLFYLSPAICQTLYEHHAFSTLLEPAFPSNHCPRLCSIFHGLIERLSLAERQRPYCLRILAGRILCARWRIGRIDGSDAGLRGFKEANIPNSRFLESFGRAKRCNSIEDVSRRTVMKFERKQKTKQTTSRGLKRSLNRTRIAEHRIVLRSLSPWFSTLVKLSLFVFPSRYRSYRSVVEWRPTEDDLERPRSEAGSLTVLERKRFNINLHIVKMILRWFGAHSGRETRLSCVIKEHRFLRVQQLFPLESVRSLYYVFHAVYQRLLCSPAAQQRGKLIKRTGKYFLARKIALEERVGLSG